MVFDFLVPNISVNLYLNGTPERDILVWAEEFSLSCLLAYFVRPMK